ncbi:hypothetical protein ACIBQ1_48250 [Nonomuraea sp. NPDC050153]|uniref:hypothetical protein n=1 Tax=Nonomuraea sp. NPDC050153 TaxID=3364359 RepID=UPI00378789C6
MSVLIVKSIAVASRWGSWPARSRTRGPSTVVNGSSTEASTSDAAGRSPSRMPRRGSDARVSRVASNAASVFRWTSGPVVPGLGAPTGGAIVDAVPLQGVLRLAGVLVLPAGPAVWSARRNAGPG